MASGYRWYVICLTCVNRSICFFSHLLVVFGGLGGLEVAIDADDDLKCSAEDADALFDFWVNTCPNQGSRTIRTEVAS